MEILTDAAFLAARYLHILFGILWMGAVLLFSLLIFPRVGRMELPHQRNFFLTFTRPVYLWAETSAILTLVMGIGLYTFTGTLGSLFTFSTPRGTVFGLALVLSLVVWLNGLLILFPRLKKATALLERSGPAAPPPPEIGPLMAPLPAVGLVSSALVLVILALMIVGTTGAY